MLTDTPVGPVRGRGDSGLPGGVLYFGGVPYAQAQRFGAPEPRTWTDPFDATRPGAAAPQTAGGLDLVPDMISERQSEDCLTAEIWTPSLDGRLPVLLWVPGGAYRIGAASLATYDGSHLARRGVVVVGVNYRLGALGWLAADGVPSNLGLRDLRAAIDWLRAVAPAFGGDPDRIVLMGESAGAGAIAHLLATADVPTSNLPIGGAILQSGAPAGTLDAPTAAWVGERMLEAAGVPDVDGLRALPVEAILAADARAVEASTAKVGVMPFHPWIDGELLHDAPFRAPLTAVPLIVGTTANEMELFRDQVPALPEDVAVMFLARKAAVLGITDEARVRDGYRACGGDLTEAAADLELHLPNELLARARTQRGNQVWRYRFTWEAPEKRACHALDLPFTFGTLDVPGWRDFAGAHDPAADALSTRMQEAWTSFATSLVPTDGGVGQWPEDSLVQLGRVATTGEDEIAAAAADLVGGMSAVTDDSLKDHALKGTVAIVTGASRGIGKGCALELGAAGATVYATGRSLSESDHPLPGTIGATAREIEELGGTGIAVACDHRDDGAVEALFDRVAAEHGRLDVLVNNAFIVVDELTSGRPFWDLPISNWDDMIDVGTRSAYVASVYAARMMVAAGTGLIANVSSSGAQEYAWQVAYGVGKCALDRLTADTAHELASHGVAVVSLWPGFVRTERIDVATEAGMLPATLDVSSAESPRFTGRAVVALATDPDVARWSGRAVSARDLADEYRFTDVDGRLPSRPAAPPNRLTGRAAPIGSRP